MPPYCMFILNLHGENPQKLLKHEACPRSVSLSKIPWNLVTIHVGSQSLNKLKCIDLKIEWVKILYVKGFNTFVPLRYRAWNWAFVNYHIFRSFIKIGDFFYSFHIERWPKFGFVLSVITKLKMTAFGFIWKIFFLKIIWDGYRGSGETAHFPPSQISTGVCMSGGPGEAGIVAGLGERWRKRG